MSILVRGIENDDQAPSSRITFLTSVAGIIDGTVDPETLSPEEQMTLTTAAEILNKYDDLTIPRAEIRARIHSGMGAKAALLEYSTALLSVAA